MIALFTSSIIAANPDSYLEVYLYDGNVTTIRLCDNPEIKFAGDDLTFLGDNIDLTVPFTSVQGILYHENSTLSVMPIQQSESVIRVLGKNVHISNLDSEASITVYSPNGMLLKQISAVSEDSTIISLSDLSDGVYIIKVNNQSLKVKLHD